MKVTMSLRTILQYIAGVGSAAALAAAVVLDDYGKAHDPQRIEKNVVQLAYLISGAALAILVSQNPGGIIEQAQRTAAIDNPGDGPPVAHESTSLSRRMIISDETPDNWRGVDLEAQTVETPTRDLRTPWTFTLIAGLSALLGPIALLSYKNTCAAGDPSAEGFRIYRIVCCAVSIFGSLVCAGAKGLGDRQVILLRRAALDNLEQYGTSIGSSEMEAAQQAVEARIKDLLTEYLKDPSPDPSVVIRELSTLREIAESNRATLVAKPRTVSSSYGGTTSSSHGGRSAQRPRRPTSPPPPPGRSALSPQRRGRPVLSPQPSVQSADRPEGGTW